MVNSFCFVWANTRMGGRSGVPCRAVVCTVVQWRAVVSSGLQWRAVVRSGLRWHAVARSGVQWCVAHTGHLLSVGTRTLEAVVRPAVAASRRPR